LAVRRLIPAHAAVNHSGRHGLLLDLQGVFLGHGRGLGILLQPHGQGRAFGLAFQRHVPRLVQIQQVQFVQIWISTHLTFTSTNDE